MQLDTYNSSVGLSNPGPVYQRADTQVGDALQGLGGTLEGVSHTLQKMQDREGALWVATTLADQQKQFSAKLHSAQASGTVQPGLYQNLSKEMEDNYQALLKQAPGKQAKDAFTIGYTHLVSQLGDRAMWMEASGHTGNVLGQGQQAVNNAIETSQNTGDWKLGAETMHNTVAAMHGILPSSVIDQFVEKSKTLFDRANYNQMAAQDPAGTARAIQDGTNEFSLDDGAKGPTIKSLERSAEYSRIASQNQATVQANTAYTQAKNGDFSQLPTARTAFISSRVAGLEGNSRADAATQAAAEFDRQSVKAQSVYSMKQDLLSIPVARYGEAVKGIADKFGDGSPEHVLASQVASQFQRQAATDPLGYVLNDPQLKKEYDAAMAGNDDNARQSVLAKVVAAQQQAGLKPSVLTPTQAQAMGQKFNSLLNTTSRENIGPAMAQLQGLRQQFGQFLPNAIADMSTMPDETSRLPMVAQVILDMPVDDPRGNLALANSLSPKDANGKLQPGQNWGATDANTWETALDKNSDFKDFISSNGQTDDTISETRQMVTRIASSLKYNGSASTPDEAVKLAVANTIGAVVTVKNGVRIPTYNENGTARSYADRNNISMNLNQAKRDLILGGHLDVPRSIEARFSSQDPASRQNSTTQAMANEMAWQTTRDGKGAILMCGTFQNGRFFPMDTAKRGGKPVILDFSTAQNVSTTPGGLGDSILKSESEKPDWLTLLRPVAAGLPAQSSKNNPVPTP